MKDVYSLTVSDLVNNCTLEELNNLVDSPQDWSEDLEDPEEFLFALNEAIRIKESERC